MLSADFRSSFWSDLDMMINYFTDIPELNREEILLHLKNTKKQGYTLSERIEKMSGNKPCPYDGGVVFDPILVDYVKISPCGLRK